MRAELSEILSRAATIADRSGPAFIPEPAGSSDEYVNGRLQQWCHIVANGDWPHFERRLALDGLTLETARRILLPVRTPPGAELPAWAETLAAVLSAAKESIRLSADRSHEADPPLPFEGVFVPFISVAQARLRDRSGSAYDLLNDGAHAALERQLLTRLSFLSAQALYLEFFALSRPPELRDSAFLVQPKPAPGQEAVRRLRARPPQRQVPGIFP